MMNFFSSYSTVYSTTENMISLVCLLSAATFDLHDYVNSAKEPFLKIHEMQPVNSDLAIVNAHIEQLNYFIQVYYETVKSMSNESFFYRQSPQNNGD